MGIHVQTDYYEECVCVCLVHCMFCILFYLLEICFQGDIVEQIQIFKRNLE